MYPCHFDGFIHHSPEVLLEVSQPFSATTQPQPDTIRMETMDPDDVVYLELSSDEVEVAFLKEVEGKPTSLHPQVPQ